MADERLNILINARNQASGALQQVKSELSGLNAAAGVASGGVMGLAGLLGGAAVAGVVVAAGRAALELGKAGAASLEMKDSFAATAQSIGANSNAILNAMRTASAGMVQDTELVASANRAMLMGAADSAEEFAKLMEVARVRSDAVGMSVGEAFSSLAEGIGRASERQLYALGINLDLAQVNEEYAASLGKTAAKLTEAEKKQSIYNAVIKSSAPIVAAAGDSLSDADKIDQAAAAWGNLKTALGELFAPPVAASAQAVANQINGLLDPDMLDRQVAAIKAAKDDIASVQAAAASAPPGVDPEGLRMIAEAQGALVSEMQAGLVVYSALTEATQTQGAAMVAAAASSRIAKDDLVGLAQAEETAAPAIDAATAALIAQQQKLNLVGDAVGGYIDKLSGMASGLARVIGVGGALAKLKDEENQVKRTTAAYEAMGWSQERIALTISTTGDMAAEQWQGIIDAPGEAAAAAERAAKQATTAYTSMTDTVAQAFDDLKGKVSGVLQGALDPGVGVNPDDLLPHKDGVNENAKRVADIAVNGFKDQSWLEDFRNDVPDIAKALQEAADPKAAAAQLLKDFQDGLVPQLIDKDAAKEKVKRMITGEATMAQLATEIAQELSQEMGISLAQATQATNSTLGTGGAAALGDSGGTASAAFGAGFDGKPVGGAFVDGLTAAIIEKYGSLETSGQTAGVQWRTGFLATTTVDIPTALVLALATLITPEVQKAIDAQKGRSGAY